MGRIAAQLKIFARKSAGRVGPVAVDSVIDTALAVVRASHPAHRRRARGDPAGSGAASSWG